MKLRAPLLALAVSGCALFLLPLASRAPSTLQVAAAAPVAAQPGLAAKVASAPSLLPGSPLSAPISLNSIPPGPFRDSLLALSSDHRHAALLRLARSEEPLSPLSTLRASARGGLFHVCAPGPRKHTHHAGCAATCRVAGSKPSAAALPDPTGLKAFPSPVSATTLAAARPVAAPVSVFQPPALSSLPGASRVLYLDFNGLTVTGTAWNDDPDFGQSTIEALPYDIDGNPATFNDAEQAVIREVWARVAEDFAPFHINVTTVEPSSFTPTTGRVLITLAVDANDNFVPGGEDAGGVAYLNVFGDDDYVSTWSPAWAIADNVGEDDAANIAEVVSHEFGHNLGLRHDGTTGSGGEYYAGHGNGATSWGPIMGASYGRRVTTFSKGEYRNANNTAQDDLAIIAAKIPYRSDDLGDSLSSYAEIGGFGATVTGLIERNTDADRFRFVNSGNRILISLRVFTAASGTRGNNLDLQAELLDAVGNRLATYTSATSPDLNIDDTRPPGVYFLRVLPSGAGAPFNSLPTGYTVYGSLGQYTVTNNTSSSPPPGILTQPVSTARPLNSLHTFTVTADSTAIRYQWRFNGADIPRATGPSLVLGPLAFTHAGDYSCLVSNELNSVLTQVASLGVYRELPQTYTVNPASNATFPVLLAGGFDDLTWSRNGQPIRFGDDPRIIPSAATLRINGVMADDAGDYVLSATFAGEPVTLGTVTLAVRPPVILSVPSTITVLRGSSPVVPITSSHDNLVYRYTGLPPDILYFPSAGTFRVIPPGPPNGSYRVTLIGTDPVGNRGSTTFTLVVEPRTLAVNVPAQLRVYPVAAPANAIQTDGIQPSYFYTGLPPGFAFVPGSGRIIARGSPAAPGVYPVFVSITDAFNNSGSASFDFIVEPIPANRLVHLVGLVARDSVNQRLGGSFQLTPVRVRGIPNGSYTGTLLLGATTYRLTGGLSAGGHAADLALSLNATAKGLPSLNLSLVLPVDPATPVTGSITPLIGSAVALGAWPAPYTATAPAAAFAGRHTFALLPPENATSLGTPAGVGFGTLTVTAAGRASWSVRLADGAPVTGSVALGADGHVTVYSRLPAPGGSLLGPLQIAATDRSLDGTLSWLRFPAPAAVRAKTALYRDGFGPLSLTALGGALVPPASGTRVLGLSAASPGVRLSFLDAALSEVHLAALALPPLTVNANNTVTRPTAVAANPAALSLAFQASAGTFSGRFVLRDPNPLKAGTTVTRNVAFQGVLLGDRALGFFLLPGLKTDAARTPATVSGSVLLEPASAPADE